MTNSISIETALTKLVTDCPELAQLEVKLSEFNIFRVLGAGRSELRHSNMLAWLCDPSASHGLGDLFTRRWLMSLMVQAAEMDSPPQGWISPIEIDVMDIDHVEAHREYDRIDLLIEIRLATGDRWIVCIENKVGARQGEDQLERYHRKVESRFSAVSRRTYVFLTAHGEEAKRPEFIETTYSSVADVLRQCIRQKEDLIGSEPKILLNHYEQLLREDFMEESEAEELARKIYSKHRQALDFIFKNRIDPISEATSALENALAREAGRLKLKMEPCNKGYVRFIPDEWAVAANSGGSAWGGAGRYLLCEVSLWSKTAVLTIVVGQAPEDWAQKVWDHALQKRPPFSPTKQKRPKHYAKVFASASDISIEKLRGLEEAKISTKLMTWLARELAGRNFKEAVAELTEFLPNLDASLDKAV